MGEPESWKCARTEPGRGAVDDQMERREECGIAEGLEAGRPRATVPQRGDEGVGAGGRSFTNISAKPPSYKLSLAFRLLAINSASEILSFSAISRWRALVSRRMLLKVSRIA